MSDLLLASRLTVAAYKALSVAEQAEIDSWFQQETGIAMASADVTLLTLIEREGGRQVVVARRCKKDADGKFVLSLDGTEVETYEAEFPVASRPPLCWLAM